MTSLVSAPARLEVRSPETGTTYHVTLVPPDVAGAGDSWHTIVFLDADDQFAEALDGYRALWARGQGRPLLLVGVGYGAHYREPGNKRIRDYTPTKDPGETEGGGADAFHAFLVETLWPWLRRRYPVSNDDPAIAGHSLGGIFVLHALFQPRPFFRRGLAVAPSLWWDERVTLRRIVERQQRDPILPARLYLGVGEYDTESMRGDLAQLEAQLAGQPFRDLRVIAERFPERGHFNVVSVGFAAGLRVLFG